MIDEIDGPSVNYQSPYPPQEKGTDTSPFLRWDSDSKPWHIGQTYEKEPASQVRCGRCHGNLFQVGQSNYWTGIRCAKCQIEFCIHDG